MLDSEYWPRCSPSVVSAQQNLCGCVKMRVLVLLVGAAALLGKPTPRAKLEKVEKGFAAVLKASPVLEDLVSPMLKEVRPEENCERW